MQIAFFNQMSTVLTKWRLFRHVDNLLDIRIDDTTINPLYYCPLVCVLNLFVSNTILTCVILIKMEWIRLVSFYRWISNETVSIWGAFDAKGAQKWYGSKLDLNFTIDGDLNWILSSCYIKKQKYFCISRVFDTINRNQLRKTNNFCLPVI